MKNLVIWLWVTILLFCWIVFIYLTKTAPSTNFVHVSVGEVKATLNNSFVVRFDDGKTCRFTNQVPVWQGERVLITYTPSPKYSMGLEYCGQVKSAQELP